MCRDETNYIDLLRITSFKFREIMCVIQLCRCCFGNLYSGESNQFHSGGYFRLCFLGEQLLAKRDKVWKWLIAFSQ